MIVKIQQLPQILIFYKYNFSEKIKKILAEKMENGENDTFLMYNCFQALKQHAMIQIRNRKIILNVTALQRVNLKQKGLKGWKQVVDVSQRLNQVRETGD